MRRIVAVYEARHAMMQAQGGFCEPIAMPSGEEPAINHCSGRPGQWERLAFVDDLPLASRPERLNRAV
jgi:hypothetical protein